jgi:hypothetical protein
METLKNYLDNMFARLPRTNEIIKLKSDLLSNMEDKYNELKADGKTENEAVGIVISEFGNIDELMNELGINHVLEGEVGPILTEDEVNDYLQVNKKGGKLIGIGVLLCILSPTFVILFDQLFEDGLLKGISKNVAEILGLIPLFILVAVAVGLFIYAGMKMDKYKYIEKDVVLPTHVRAALQQRHDAFQPSYIFTVIIGVALCILSPVILFITSAISEDAEAYGIVGLLLTVAVAVFIFIYFGVIRESMAKLLKLDEYSKVTREDTKVVRAVAAVVWPLAALFYLVSGFVYNRWHINWIVFPIVGILFGMFCGAYSILKEKNR